MGREESISYEEYLARIREQEATDRERFAGGGDGRPRPVPRPGDPSGGKLPPTGNEEFDVQGAVRELHSRSAMRAADLDLAALARYRRELEKNPYGPDHHIMDAQGNIRPAAPGRSAPRRTRELPVREIHSDSAIAEAGFDPDQLRQYRERLRREPYGPREHRVAGDGAIRPEGQDDSAE